MFLRTLLDTRFCYRASYRIVLLSILLLLILVIQPLVVAAQSCRYTEFQRGMNYVWWERSAYLSSQSDKSLEDLASTGTMWVALVVTWYQQTIRDNDIARDENQTPTDDSVSHAIDTIHRLGMHVMLRPAVDLEENSPYWRGQIDPTDVQSWFLSYRVFILHYAILAQYLDVEEFSVGTELISMTQSAYTPYWNNLIEAVREAYHGLLVYSASFNEWERIEFWDNLDFVGVDAYFPLGNKSDPSLNQVKQEWMNTTRELESWQETIKKQIIFTEIGWWSVAGASVGNRLDSYCSPSRSTYNSSKCTLDQGEQATLYEATFEVFWGRPWFQGIFWWAWYPYGTCYHWGEGGQADDSYSPHNKPSEMIIRSWYARIYAPCGASVETVAALTAIQGAEFAIANAQREGRTVGLDTAMSLLREARAAYERCDIQQSAALSRNAMKATDETFNPAILYLFIGSTLVLLLVTFLVIRRRRKLSRSAENRGARMPAHAWDFKYGCLAE